MIIFQLLPFTCTFPSLPTQYLDEETVEQFEDRVLNKRAAQVGIFSHLSTWNFLTTTTRRHALDGPLITFQTFNNHLFLRTPLIPVALSAEAKNGGDSSSRVRLYYQVSIKILQLSNWRKNKVKNGGQLIKFWICYSRRKDTRKIAAQKFYSLLVLQKVRVDFTLWNEVHVSFLILIETFLLSSSWRWSWLRKMPAMGGCKSAGANRWTGNMVASLLFCWWSWQHGVEFDVCCPQYVI